MVDRPKPDAARRPASPARGLARDDEAEFLAYLRVECGLAQNTIVAYRQDLTLFREFLAEIEVEFPDAVDRRTVILFLGWCRDRGHATTTLRRRLSAIRMFFRYLGSVRGSENDPAQEILFVKAWERLPKTLSIRDTELLLAAPDELSAVTRERDRAILELLYETGARVSEVCDLEIGRVFSDERYVRLRGKGNKERIVPVGRRALDSIERYRAGERRRVVERFGEMSALFLSVRGRPLGRETVLRLVKRYAAAASLPSSVSPHTLRHSYATHLLGGGAGLREVQELLGHADIRTTEIYTHVDRERVREAHRRCHPRG